MDRELDIMKPKNRLPNVKIYNVQNIDEKTDDEMCRRSVEQNGLSSDRNDCHFELKYKLNGRDSMVSLIVEVDGITYKNIMEKGCLYYAFGRCRVEEFVNIVRCYKCNEIGHLVRDCKNDNVCGFFIKVI